ncbi:hypothetical protein LZ32DRAFT_161689 [Colletotrichum eremochloae]|nr:hypothetical protein LZ32DRAFT_161689 [Colletotrichum eremochloae]
MPAATKSLRRGVLHFFILLFVMRRAPRMYNIRFCSLVMCFFGASLEVCINTKRREKKQKNNGKKKKTTGTSMSNRKQKFRSVT